jgi:CBS domain-containing protein
MRTSTRGPASAIAHAPLLTVPPSATLREVARILNRECIGAIVVQGEHGLVGILTERDLLDAVARDVDLDMARAEHHLSAPIMSARPEDTVLDVALQLLDAGTRHLPVIDDLGRPQGMVSLRDLLRPLVIQALTPPEHSQQTA